MDKAIHLGDGAYASTDGYGIWITANHHEPTQATDKVYLEPETIRRLSVYLKQYEDSRI